MKFLFIVFCFFYAIHSRAQPSEEELSSKYNGISIALLKKDASKYYYKIQDAKTKKWGVFEVSLDFQDDLDETFIDSRLTESIFDEIDALDTSPFFIVRSKKRFGVYHPVNYEWFGIEAPKQEYPYHEILIDGGAAIYARQQKMWGLIGNYTGELVRECIYFNREEIPLDGIGILESTSGVNIETTSFQNELIYLIKNRDTKSWGAYQYRMVEAYDENGEPFEYEELVNIIPPVNDSIITVETADFFIVKKDEKYGFCLPNYVYDSISLSYPFEDAKIVSNNNIYYAVAKQNGRWGQVDIREQFEISGFVYEHIEDVPINIAVDEWSAGLIRNACKALNADLVEMDPGNGDGAFRARNRETKKWGMFQSIDANQFNEMIPMEFDSVQFFPWNASFTAVHLDGKIGIYLSSWNYGEQAKLTVPCIYENYQRFNADGTTKLACQKNGKWGWVNWLTGQEESDFIYKTDDDLPYPYFQQKIWFDEE